MVLLIYDKINEEKGLVYTQIFNLEGLSQDTINKGVLVENIPETENITGKTAELYVNPITKELWYEYKDRPLLPEEKITEQQKQIDNLALTILQLQSQLGGM